MIKLKINYLIFILFFVFTQCNKSKETILIFDKISYDFGTFDWSRGKTKTINFKYTNKGSNPLIITNIETSCGCTIPDWNNEPLMPNETSNLKIIYDSKTLGRFKKSITVFYNGESSPQKLIIKGEVVYHK